MSKDSGSLQSIKDLLEQIKSILVLSNQKQIEEAKESLLPQGSLKRAIYDLCDGTNTTHTIAQTLQKDETSVRARLSVLRREGLIRSAEKGGNQVHEQIM